MNLYQHLTTYGKRMTNKHPIIILFNGPPAVGKDTHAAMAASELESIGFKVDVVKFASPLKTAACAIYCGNNTAIFAEEDRSENKSNPSDTFLGKSCREVQIAISETFMKPLHGERVFGKLLAETIKRRHKQGTQIFLVSDSGFKPEAEELLDQFGEDNIILFRLKREGKSFEGDSRSYINLDDYLVPSYDVFNYENNPGRTSQEVVEIIKRALGVKN